MGSPDSKMDSSSIRGTLFDRLSIEVAANRIRSIEEALAFLPERLRQNHALMYDSRSLQKSSFENPRAIIFDDSASFVAAFTDKSMTGGDRLEIMQFREESQSYEFREIIADANRLKVSEANPGKCKRCHTEALIPNWRGYPFWTGAYGNDQNSFMRGANDSTQGQRKQTIYAPEFEPFKKFLARAPSHERYKFLARPKNEKLWPFSADAVNVNSFIDIPTRWAPNRRLGILLNYRAARQIARRVRESRGFKEMPDAALFAMLNCENKAFNPVTGGDLDRPDDELRKAVKKMLDESFLNGRTWEDVEVNYMLAEMGLGLSAAEWNLDHMVRFNPRSKLEKNFESFHMGGYGQAYTRSLVAASLLAERSEFRSFFAKGYDWESNPMLVDQPTADVVLAQIPFMDLRDISEKVCTTITPRAYTQLKKHRPAPAKLKAPQILSSCIGCHSSPNQISWIHIPFNNPKALKAALTEPSVDGPPLIEALKYRLSPQTKPSAQMPPDESSLQSSESTKDLDLLREAVWQYIQNL